MHVDVPDHRSHSKGQYIIDSSANLGSRSKDMQICEQVDLKNFSKRLILAHVSKFYGKFIKFTKLFFQIYSKEHLTDLSYFKVFYFLILIPSTDLNMSLLVVCYISICHPFHSMPWYISLKSSNLTNSYSHM